MIGEGENMQLEEIQKKCLDSEGYLMFAAYLTAEKDKEQRPIIQFQYRRYHFSLEDSKAAILALKKFVDGELQILKDSDTPEAG